MSAAAGNFSTERESDIAYGAWNVALWQGTASDAGREAAFNARLSNSFLKAGLIDAAEEAVTKAKHHARCAWRYARTAIQKAREFEAQTGVAWPWWGTQLSSGCARDDEETAS